MGIKARDFYDAFLKSSNDALEKSNQTRLKINDNDMLMEKGFLAFLQDFLNYKGDRKAELNNLLKQNNELGKEVLIKELKGHLDELKSLSNDILNKKGLDTESLGGIAKNLNNESFTNFTTNLLTKNGLNNVSELGAKAVLSVSNPSNVVLEVGKNVVKKLILKQ